MTDTLVRLLHVDVRKRLVPILSDVSLTIRRGETWVVIGENGSGKSTLGGLIAGTVQAWRGVVDASAVRASIVSFERAEAELRKDRREDTSGILHGATDPGRSPADLLTPRLHDRLADPDSQESQLVDSLGLRKILDRGIRFLSTGELRKTLLAAELLAEPDLLVVDDPYDGLDRDSRSALTTLLADSSTRERATVIITGREREVPPFATHVIALMRGRVTYTGTADSWRSGVRTAGMAGADSTSDEAHGHDGHPAAANPSASPTPAIRARSDEEPSSETGQELIRMNQVSVAYGSAHVLHDLSWTVASGDRWIIHGPNGSGKSTLLSLITGENPKLFGQEIAVFGRLRGTGESVWEIKRKIGFVSGDLHVRFPGRLLIRDVVLSGFHDSVGLYVEPSGYEIERATALMESLGIAQEAQMRLREVSFGLQRLALIARALIKDPHLLIVDEPCQGLDDAHVRLVLRALEAVVVPGILYVTHDPSELFNGLTHELELVPGPLGSVARIAPL